MREIDREREGEREKRGVKGKQDLLFSHPITTRLPVLPDIVGSM